MVQSSATVIHWRYLRAQFDPADLMNLPLFSLLCVFFIIQRTEIEARINTAHGWSRVDIIP